MQQKHLAANLSIRKKQTNWRERAVSSLDGLKTASFVKELFPVFKNTGLIFSFFFLFASCSSESTSTVNPLANRGKQVYMANCISCHSPNPRQDGPLGPVIYGSSKELLEYRLLKGSYPPSYFPKRPSTLMPRFEHLAGDIEALTSYLNE